MIKDIINELDQYSKILILGYGREGKTTYNLIRKYLPDKSLTIADKNEEIIKENEYLKQDSNLELILGENYLDTMDDYDIIIKSPGINFKYIDHSKISSKITSQIDLFLRHTKSFTIGVTGTKGKSTTSTLITYVLNEYGKKAILVGNIGIPVFEKIEEFSDEDIIVLELSCHQLQFVKASPNIGIILNIFEEHLDLYKSYDEYKNAKLNIFKYQKEDDYKIYGIDSDTFFNNIKGNNKYEITKNKQKINSNKAFAIEDENIYFIENGKSTLVYDKSNKRLLLGEHNLYNVAVAYSVLYILNLDISKANLLINEFKPLENRIDLVGTFNDIMFYDDTFSTIPETTINCIKAIPNINSIIIGGMDRKVDLSMLSNYLLSFECKVSNYIFLPETGHNIAKELKEKGCNKNILIAKDMNEAVDYAFKYTGKGNACALSPSAASYNVYKFAGEKAKHYIECIKAYKNKE